MILKTFCYYLNQNFFNLQINIFWKNLICFHIFILKYLQILFTFFLRNQNSLLTLIKEWNIFFSPWYSIFCWIISNNPFPDINKWIRNEKKSTERVILNSYQISNHFVKFVTLKEKLSSIIPRNDLY